MEQLVPALDAFHARLTDEELFEGEDRPEGVLGCAVQLLPPVVLVVTDRALEAADTLPAESLALTVKE